MFSSTNLMKVMKQQDQSNLIYFFYIIVEKNTMGFHPSDSVLAQICYVSKIFSQGI